ncbi:Hypothetical predicted protein [Cloeon dipterum]|uniref:Uncharacterized protein n=1 Tax=Cloeon dipterum TaxID=197152 RepID=A0A8S1DTX6_9INSE|nr:Hypothetical predicted protein [Cloeon dipterum]
MSNHFWPFWRIHKLHENDVIPVDELVPCSPNNPIPSYVVATFNNCSPHPQPGYAYFREGSFRSGYFTVEKKQLLVREKEFYYILVGGDVSFRPHTVVPENLRFKVGSTKDNKPIYIGTIDIGTEVICGSVIDGVCYAYKDSNCYSEDKLVPCSPNNRISSYVVATLNKYSCYPQPGYVYYNEGLFSSGFFIQGTDEMVTTYDFYFLVGGKVPENAVKTWNKNLDVYVARTCHEGELLPGYVRDGCGATSATRTII